jgi:hypothetical protein
VNLNHNYMKDISQKQAAASVITERMRVED